MGVAGCWQQVTPLELEDRTLPLLFTFQHSCQGLRYSETPRGASFIASSVPCPGAVCSKPRLDFLDFADQCRMKFPTDHHLNVSGASQAQPRVSPTSGQSRGKSQPWLLTLIHSTSPVAEQHWEDGCCCMQLCSWSCMPGATQGIPQGILRFLGSSFQGWVPWRVPISSTG